MAKKPITSYIGDIDLGEWIHSCNPLRNKVNFDYEVGFSVSIEIDKLEKSLKAVAGLLGDKKLNKVISDIKGVVPGGTFKLTVGLLDEPYSTPCPGDPSAATLIGYNIYLTVSIDITVTVGAVSGSGFFMFKYRVAGDSEECACPKKQVAGFFFPGWLGGSFLTLPVGSDVGTILKSVSDGIHLPAQLRGNDSATNNIQGYLSGSADLQPTEDVGFTPTLNQLRGNG